jgi:hypothetical protein
MPDDLKSRSLFASHPYRWSGPRPRSLASSLVLHSILAFCLLWFSSSTNIAPEPAEQIAPPHEHIIWYHLKELPKISSNKDGPVRAEQLNQNVIIHQAPDAAHDNRLVFRTPERKTSQQKAPAPDMVAVQRGADSPVRPEHPVEAIPPPAPVKPTPKTFVAPAALPPAATARVKLEEPPPPELAKLVIPDSGLSALTSEKLKVSRRFVPPPPVNAPPRTTAGNGSAVPDAPTLPGSGGSSDINALIVNTVHVGGVEVAPPRQSAIAVGPATGSSSDGGGRSGLQIPGVTVIPRSGPASPESAEASLRNPKNPLNGAGGPVPQPFITTRVAPLEHTLSAPLPPSSRTVPRLIEAHFHGRVIYTMLLPMKGLPGYAGDWTIWFAEREPLGGGDAGATMRAPLPVRKPIRADAASREPAPGTIQLAATMNKAGKLASVAVIAGSSPAADATVIDAAIEDLEAWEFLPALRNLQAVDIDLIIEIPFGINRKNASPANVPVLSGVDRTQSTQHN